MVVLGGGFGWWLRVSAGCMFMVVVLGGGSGLWCWADGCPGFEIQRRQRSFPALGVRVNV